MKPPTWKPRLRRVLHGLLLAALRARSRPGPPRGPAATVLVLAPHQDDEALGCAYLIAARTERRLPVHVAYLTDGSGSHPGHPTLALAALARQRQDEAQAAMGVLGVDPAHLHFLEARDGTLPHLVGPERAAVIRRIGDLLADLRPTELFLPCRWDGSSEHEAAFALVREACLSAGVQPRLFEFPVWSWWSPRLLWRPLRRSRRVWRLHRADLAHKKEQALAAYVSQLQPTAPWAEPVLSREFLTFFLSDEEFFFEISPSPGP